MKKICKFLTNRDNPIQKLWTFRRLLILLATGKWQGRPYLLTHVYVRIDPGKLIQSRMKSPSRPRIPLSDRKMILQDQSYLIQKEINQRRQTRVQQARQRANEVARVIRQRTEREKIRLVRVCGSFILYVYLPVRTTVSLLSCYYYVTLSSLV